jgi:predicted nucleic-acid-binding Zn-ribbon protein
MRKKADYSKKPKSLGELIDRCPKCGRTITWFNDIPLKGYCWGTHDNEHEEYSVVVCVKKIAELSSRE